MRFIDDPSDMHPGASAVKLSAEWLVMEVVSGSQASVLQECCYCDV